MKIVDGWVCPDLLSGPDNYLARCADLEAGAFHVKQRRVAIQAGGHIGTVPVWLADRFERVYTFEPDADNHAALVANCHARHPRNIWSAQGVLGNKRRSVSLVESAKSTGQHRVSPLVLGPVPTFRIDDLCMDDVDAIFLDVEGFEIQALRGAVDTLNRCRPIVMAEENKRALDHGFRIGDLARFLSTCGYAQVTQVHDDLVFVPMD